ncbi:MAG: malate dehydrogenase [Calditrichaeota bacterium]|nr:malate dehydrogenase [Calditrichota bacterium]MCB9368071.1 malate dehydrogenase [Calditrichota bacterium]
MKVTVIGAGNVGASCAYILSDKNICKEIVLLDIAEGIPQGKALDMFEATPIGSSSSRILGTNDYKDTANSDIIVMTAGKPRTPGMSRDDLLAANIEIMRSAIGEAAKASPNAIVIIVSNPLDAMSYAALKLTGFPHHRVFGMAGILDTARYRTFIAMELGVSVKDIAAVVLGGHGDTMVPVPRLTTVGGVPLTELVSKERLESIVQRTRDGGAEIVKYLKTGSAYYAPAAAAVEMVESIIIDQKRVLPCAAWLTGEYGCKDIYMGVPVIVGRKGVEKILEIKLTDEERKMFDHSADAVRNVIAATKL